MAIEEYKYFAFISYNSRDTEWGKRVQRKLERYRMPATLCSERGWQRYPIRPVFFAPTDIQPGELSTELQERLRASRNLIVVCSPHSAQSEWVGREISYFIELGRAKNIYLFIVDGVPHSGDVATECFNPALNVLTEEILGVNIHEKVYRLPWLNRERAYIQLVTRLLNIEFDALWQRHKRRVMRHATAWVLGVIAVLSALVGVWWFNRPVDVSMSLQEFSIPNPHLPQLREAVVTMTLDNEIKVDTIHSLSKSALFANIPRRFIYREVKVRVECPDFLPLDTLLQLTPKVNLQLYRNSSVYGDVRFRLWNVEEERGVAHCRVVVDGHEAISDAEGYVSLIIPLEQQKRSYPISAEIPLTIDSLPMPCGESDCVVVQ